MWFINLYQNYCTLWQFLFFFGRIVRIWMGLYGYGHLESRGSSTVWQISRT